MSRSLVNLKDGPAPLNSVYIGRPGKWGNPFILGQDGTRTVVIEKYRTYLLNNPELLGQLEELRGKWLVCHCAPKACHGDVLLELLNPPKQLLNYE